MSQVIPLNRSKAVPVPLDIEIEQALLGALLTRNETFDLIAEISEAKHFSEPLHQRIFDAIAKLIRKGQTASPLTLRSTFSLDPEIQSVTGGPGYLAELCRFNPGIDERVAAGVLRDLYLRREMMVIAEEIRLTAADPPPDMVMRDQVEEAERMLYALTGGDAGLDEDGPTLAADIADLAIARAEEAFRDPERVGASTGLPSLDEAMGKLMPGDLIVLGGAPSMGKTSLAQQIAWYLAAQGRNVAVWSIEMTAVEYINRHIAQLAGVSATRIDYGRISHDELLGVIRARDAFNDVPLHVFDGGNVTVPKIRSRARRMHRKRQLGAIVIDHLRFLRPNDARAPERDQMQQLTKDLKMLAKELGVPVLLISHVNREYNKRDNKRPQMSDLYGASGIEQNADVVLFVHREHYWLRKSRPAATDLKEMDEWTNAMQRAQGKATLICDKRRRGPCGDAEVAFHDDLTLFTELNAEVTIPGRLL